MSDSNISSRNSLTSMYIDHVMLSVPNYEETVQWYQQKLDATIETGKAWDGNGLFC